MPLFRKLGFHIDRVGLQPQSVTPPRERHRWLGWITGQATCGMMVVAQQCLRSTPAPGDLSTFREGGLCRWPMLLAPPTCAADRIRSN